MQRVTSTQLPFEYPCIQTSANNMQTSTTAINGQCAVDTNGRSSCNGQHTESWNQCNANNDEIASASICSLYFKRVPQLTTKPNQRTQS
eukprot:1019903-Amphidinium_carterae.2